MARLDVRLDAEHRRRLEELVEKRGMSIFHVVRCLIDDAYEDIAQERRRHAVDRLIGLEVEEPPNAASLSRELEAAMSPVAFIDANVPVYDTGRDHVNEVPCGQVLMRAAEHPLSFITDVESSRR